jgi:anti-sigma B factor antagonist
VDDSASQPGDNLVVRASSIDGVLVLGVRGELDVFTAPQLAEAIDNGIAASLTALIVDLSEVAFLASAGMTVLVTGHETALRSGKRFMVVADGPATSRPMMLTGLDQAVSLYPTLDAALKDVV